MKRISFFFVCFALLSSLAARAEDAATVERLNKLDGLVQDLLEDKANQKKQIAALEKEIQSLREQLSKPGGNFAGADDLKNLAEKIKEVDKRRVEDNERIVKKIDDLGKTLSGAASGKKPKPTPPPANNSGTNTVSTGSDKVFEHVIKANDTFDAIARAYNKEKGLKLTVERIQNANPGVDPTKLQVGQKIFIPAQ